MDFELGSSPTASLSLENGPSLPYECCFPLIDFLFLSRNGSVSGVLERSMRDGFDNVKVAIESFGLSGRHDKEQHMDQYWQQQGIHRVRQHRNDGVSSIPWEKETWFVECLKGTLLNLEDIGSADVCLGLLRPPEGTGSEYVLGSYRQKMDGDDADLVLTSRGVCIFECGKYSNAQLRIPYADIKYVQQRLAPLTAVKEAGWRSGSILLQTVGVTQQAGSNMGSLGLVMLLCMFALGLKPEVRVLQLKKAKEGMKEGLKEGVVSTGLATVLGSPCSSNASSISTLCKPTISKVAKQLGTKEDCLTRYLSTPPARKPSGMIAKEKASLKAFIEEDEVIVKRHTRSSLHCALQVQKPPPALLKSAPRPKIHVLPRARLLLPYYTSHNTIGVEMFENEGSSAVRTSSCKMYNLGLGVRSLGWEKSSVCSGLSRFSSRLISPSSLPSRYSRRHSVPTVDGSPEALVTQLLRQAVAAWTIALDFLERTLPAGHPPSFRLFGSVHGTSSKSASSNDQLSIPIPLDGAIQQGLFQHQVLFVIVATILEHTLTNSVIGPLAQTARIVLDCALSQDRARETKKVTDNLQHFLRKLTNALYICFIGDTCARSDAYHASGGLTALQMACCAQATDSILPIYHSAVSLEDWLQLHPGVTTLVPDRSPENTSTTRSIYTTACVVFMRQISENMNITHPVYSSSYKPGICHCCLQSAGMRQLKECQLCGGVVCSECSSKTTVTALVVRAKEGFVQSPGYTPVINITATIACVAQTKTLVCEPCLHQVMFRDIINLDKKIADRNNISHTSDCLAFTHLLHPPNTPDVSMPLPNHGLAMYSPKNPRTSPLSWRFSSLSELASATAAITALPNTLEFNPVCLSQAVIYVNNVPFKHYVGIPHLHVVANDPEGAQPVYLLNTFVPPPTTMFLTNKFSDGKWKPKVNLQTQGINPTKEQPFQRFFGKTRLVGEEQALYTGDLYLDNHQNNVYTTRLLQRKPSESAPDSTLQCVLTSASAISMGALRNIRNICSFGKQSEIPNLYTLCSELEQLFCHAHTDEQVIPDVDIPDQHCFQVAMHVVHDGHFDMLLLSYDKEDAKIDSTELTEVLGEVVKTGGDYSLRSLRVNQPDEAVLSAYATYFGQDSFLEDVCIEDTDNADEMYTDQSYVDERLNDINEEIMLPGILPSENCKEPGDHVTLVFTDIESSTKQWENDSKAMDYALTAHEHVLRAQLLTHKGYEVKTEGDAFMIAFSSVVDAVQWCVNTQRLQCSIKWPKEVNRVSKQVLWSSSDVDSSIITLETVVDKNGRVDLCISPSIVKNDPEPVCKYIFNGIRVRMGQHYDTPLCKRNPVTDRLDYFGVVVNRAARISDCAHGGQVVCTAQVQSAVNEWKQQCLKWGVQWTTIARKQHGQEESIATQNAKLDSSREIIELTERKLIQCRTDYSIRTTQEELAAQYKQYSVRSGDMGKLNMALLNTERDRQLVEQKQEKQMPQDSLDNQAGDTRLQELQLGRRTDTQLMEEHLKGLLLTSEDTLEQQALQHRGKYAFKGIGDSQDVYELEDAQQSARSSYFGPLRAEKVYEKISDRTQNDDDDDLP